MYRYIFFVTPTFRLAEERDLGAACDFLAARHPDGVRDWPAAALQDYVGYYVRGKLCALALAGGCIVGLAMGRPVARIEDGVDDRWKLDWAGPILWVECVAALTPISALLRFSVSVLAGYGCRLDRIAWNRGPYNYRPIVAPLSRLAPRLEVMCA